MTDEQHQNLLSSPLDEQSNSDDQERSNAENTPLSSGVLKKIASLMGATGVGMGAFGAHALKETLAKRGAEAMWQTATIYQLFHATAVLSLATSSSSNPKTKRNHLLAGKLMGIGNLLFSGSIYCLALGIGPKKILGPITPLGGLLMIGGWVVVGMS